MFGLRNSPEDFERGSGDGAVRALACHQSGSGPGVICGLRSFVVGLRPCSVHDIVDSIRVMSSFHFKCDDFTN